MTDAEVLFGHDGAVAQIVLNRPRAMNALTYPMITAITEALTGWKLDDSVETVLLTGAGERGLCAGGDIVSLYRDLTEGGEGAATFWADEYRLDALVAGYPKPYVAIMDGVVLGGGVGISAHGSVRIVTERTKIGMPEVGIGFVPDVGGTWLLSHAPGELGTHLALTGGTASGADAIAVGLADHFVESERLSEFVEALAASSVAEAVERFASEPPASGLLAARGWIDECYASNDAAEIVARLAASEEADARAAASVILEKSPTAVSIALASLRRVRGFTSLEQALDQEFRVSLHLAEGTEVTEGIRAQVIDKDRQPKWSPATLDEVGDVESYFASLAGRELGLSATTAPRQDRSRI
jgi:enoyl-CoA hydratase